MGILAVDTSTTGGWLTVSVAGAASASNNIVKDPSGTLIASSSWPLWLAPSTVPSFFVVPDGSYDISFSRAGVELGGANRLGAGIAGQSPFVLRPDASQFGLRQIVEDFQLSTGEAVFDMDACQSAAGASSGTLFLSYFIARRTETVAAATLYCQTVGITPGSNFVGLYSIDAYGNLALQASKSDATSFLTTGANKMTFTAPTTKTAGGLYAVAALFTGWGTYPAIMTAGMNNIAMIAAYSNKPLRAAQFSGQTGLPTTIAVGSLTAIGRRVYAELTPS